MINSLGNTPQLQQVRYTTPTVIAPIAPQAQGSITNTANPAQNNNQDVTTNYLQALGQQNMVQIQQPQVNFTPSGVEDFENMVVKDASGKVVQSVQYTKEGDKIIQNIDVQCCDGSVFKKVITREGNKKAMTLDFKDKDGNQLATVNRTYEQIDEDTAISTLNGKEYKITGLKSGNVVTIEHNGAKQVIDLGKKLVDYTEDERENKNGTATQEQKDFLIQMIKKQPADILLRIDKETDSLVFLKTDDYEGFYNPEGRALKASKKSDSSLITHELGHAIYDLGNDKDWGDTNSEYFATRAAEIENMKNSPVPQKIRDMMRKFTTQDYEGWKDYTPEAGLKQGANEEFAETFNFMNNIDIDNVWYKSTGIIQYMPKSFLMAYKGAMSLEPEIENNANLEPERTYIPNPEGVKVAEPDTSAANQALLQADMAEKYINETLKAVS